MIVAPDSSQTAESNPDSDGNDNGTGNGNPRLTTTQRTVTQTSNRHRIAEERIPAQQRDQRAEAHASPVARRQATKANAGEVPSMVLTQIHFNKGMRGRFGSGKENDKTDHRWSEFYRQRRGLPSQGREHEDHAQPRSAPRRWLVPDRADAPGHSGTAAGRLAKVDAGQAIP